jgi:hypothetical protein
MLDCFIRITIYYNKNILNLETILEKKKANATMAFDTSFIIIQELRQRVRYKRGMRYRQTQSIQQPS